ncbi:UDP-forming cellulose synthase catalytic subunit [Patescibacteria group bacterium]|nr:MAG: UDP-forming cellulose synthase catalytic subunit [Patescibacteria group bacterium]
MPRPYALTKQTLRAFITDLLTDQERLTKGITYAGVSILVYLFFHLAQFYLALPGQFIVGWGSVLALLICERITRFTRPPLRLLFILLSVFVDIRYLIWRTSETLIYERLLDFSGTILIYAAEVYAIVLHLLNIFVNVWPQERKIMPLPEETSKYPSVDVFIPTYNEPLDIIETTAIAALNIDYSKDRLTVHVLDDGATVAKRNDPETAQAAWERHYALRRMARALGVSYITRERNVRAKAGNINHAIRHTTSDLVLILDCDHVPARDILKNTVGWFIKDSKLAMVQTPHFFINPSPVEKNVEALRDAPSESELFYRASHLGLDLWNASFFCGSAGILRRRYLEEVGGFSGETVTEDCETAYALHRRGYNSAYIARSMVCGLSPETFDDLILQRSRWAQGMTQIMILRNPLFEKGLKLYQRLCYFNNGLYWFFGIPRVIFLLAPAAFLFLGLHVYYASVPQVLAYAVPHLLCSMILINFFYGKYRWPLLSDLHESIQSLFLLPVVFSAMVNPRKPSFKVTPKGKTLESDDLSRLALPFLIMCTVLTIAIPTAIVEWFKYPLYRGTTFIALVWCLYNLLLSMAGLGAFLDRRQIRRHHRMWAKGKLSVFFPRLKITVEASIQDISLSGIGLLFHIPFPLTSREHIIMEARDSYGGRYGLEARIQRFVKRGEMFLCGTEFILPDEQARLTATRFVYGDSQRWMDYWSKRTRKVSFFKMLWFIVKMAGKGFTVSLLAYKRLLHVPVTYAKLIIRRRKLEQAA